jgi:hypothetical protein
MCESSGTYGQRALRLQLRLRLSIRAMRRSISRHMTAGATAWKMTLVTRKTLNIVNVSQGNPKGKVLNF